MQTIFYTTDAAALQICNNHRIAAGVPGSCSFGPAEPVCISAVGGFNDAYYTTGTGDNHARSFPIVSACPACTTNQGGICVQNPAPAAGTPYLDRATTFINQPTQTPCVAAGSGCPAQQLRQGPAADGSGIGIAIISYTPPGVLGEFESAGAYCSAGSASGVQSNPVQDQDQNNCATNSTGTKICKANNNCGTVNGEYKCLGTAPPNGTCVTTETGRTVCSYAAGGSIASPPAPDNGTPNK